LLAITLALWALHHLDYPFLRARGVWSPWGYYIDIVLVLVTTAGLGELVLEDLQRGVNALVALAPATLPSGQESSDELGALLAEALKLPTARGSAVARVNDGKVGVVRAAGALEEWARVGIPDRAARDITASVQSQRPRVISDWHVGEGPEDAFRFAALLPIALEHAAPAALVLVGDARHPFAALDERFLIALGSQIGGAMQSRALVDRLRARTDELARLATRTIGQQEEERRRLSLELHDETAQVFAAVKLRLGLLREQADPVMSDQLGQLVELVDTGMRSIRSVTESLRPTVLDELGIAAAIRSLVADFEQRTRIRTRVTGVDGDFRLAPDVELALYRAIQEALSNVARHTGASAVYVDVKRRAATISVSVRDDGTGFPGELDHRRLAMNGHAGLAGIRERVAALGGMVTLGRAAEGGAEVALEMPLHE
ncbi:MAG: sensor histidine kinase, partial [Gemmatimonadota bacterium]